MNLNNVDIVYVTFNSVGWIDACFGSYAKSLFPCEKINITVVDNGSADSTLEKLETVKNSYGFSSFNIIKMRKNRGFGSACNAGFRKGSADIVCFFNIDTEIYPDTLTKIIEEIGGTEDAKTVLWELMQYPYEHPKTYDILTGETDWGSGACFAIRRDAFEKAGGFDEGMFMYAEDVDLSFRLRSMGYRIKYSPAAGIIHYAYSEEYQLKPLQYTNSIINNLLLRWRFGDRNDIKKGYEIYKIIQNQEEEAFTGAKKALRKAYRKHFAKIPHFAKWRLRKDVSTAGFNFYDLDYARHREGAFCYLKRPGSNPLVSVIVRTCGRPEVLRETLISLRRQIYKNIEIIVVEDGDPVSQKMIENEFPDDRVIYSATNEKVGRSRAGNIAMEKATGKYLNILDDDDLFYADHIETLVAALEGGGYRAAYAVGEESRIVVNSTEPYIYDIVNTDVVYARDFDREALFDRNYIPIQTIMFERGLFEEYGGFDLTLDQLEDWDLWVRYAVKNDFLFVEKSTSIYRVPYEKKLFDERYKQNESAYERCVQGFKKYGLDAGASR